MNKKKYVLIHNHRHGTSVFKFTSEIDYNGWFSDENDDMSDFDFMFQKLDIDFEKDSNESIDIILVGDTFIDID